jgi:hypothetical protein
MYINTNTLIQHTEADIRAMFPNTSFPNPFIAPSDYTLVFPTPQPAHDPITQTTREISPVMSVKGAWEQQWEVIQLDNDTIAANQSAKLLSSRLAAKDRRTAEVDSITITTAAGNTFDGDEISQGRMARAILSLQATGTPSTQWILHNNNVIQVDVAELGEALALSGAAQSAIWVI